MTTLKSDKIVPRVESAPRGEALSVEAEATFLLEVGNDDKEAKIDD